MLSNNLSALVAEDEAIIAMDTRETLLQAGFKHVLTTHTMSAAYTLAASHYFDLALLDVSLGGEPIFPFANTLMDKNVPIVFLTGMASASFPAQFGNIPTLEKPFCDTKLLKRPWDHHTSDLCGRGSSSSPPTPHLCLTKLSNIPKFRSNTEGMDPFIVELIAELPLEMSQSLMHYARFKMPYKKYQRKEFTLCLINCANALTQHFGIEITERYSQTLRIFIDEIVEIFSEYIADNDITCERQLGSSIDCVLTNTYEEYREKPPPEQNYSAQLVSNS